MKFWTIMFGLVAGFSWVGGFTSHGQEWARELLRIVFFFSVTFTTVCLIWALHSDSRRTK